MDPQKVAIITRNPNFLPPILKELEQRNCDVKQVMFSDDPVFNLISIQEAMNWADCAFFDFCFEPLPQASRLLTDCRITARLHGLEVYSPAMQVIAWDKVNLVCSGPQYIRLCREKLASPASITQVNIGVSVENMPEKHSFGHNIGLIAVTPLPRKRIYTTIESFCDLISQSHDKWVLHIRGGRTTGYRNQEALEYLKFIREFKDVLEAERTIAPGQVMFHNFLSDKDYSTFLQNIDVIVSNSMQEGYHKSIFEAMCFGAHPLVHRWLGADMLYPKESLFTTQREFVNKIVEWDEQTLTKKQKDAKSVQALVKKYHDQDFCAKAVVDTILGEDNGS